MKGDINDIAVEDSFVIRPGKIHVLMGIIWILLCAGIGTATYFIFTGNRDDLSFIHRLISISPAFLCLIGLYTILSAIPGFNEISVKGNEITILRFFKRWRTYEMSEISRFVYFHKAGCYGVYINGKKRFAFFIDPCYKNADRLISMFEENAVRNETVDKNHPDMVQRKIGSDYKLMKIFLFIQLAGIVFFGLFPFSRLPYSFAAICLITVFYMTMCFMTIMAIGMAMRVYPRISYYANIDCNDELFLRIRKINTLMLIFAVFFHFVIWNIAKSNGVLIFIN